MKGFCVSSLVLVYPAGVVKRLIEQVVRDIGLKTVRSYLQCNHDLVNNWH